MFDVDFNRTQEKPNTTEALNHSSNKPHLKNVGVRRGSGGLDRKLGRCIGHWVNGVGVGEEERRETGIEEKKNA